MKAKKGIKKILGNAARFAAGLLLGWTLVATAFFIACPSLRDFSKARAQKWFKEPTKKVEIKKPKRRYALFINGYDFKLQNPNWAVKNITCGYKALKKIGYTDDDMVVFSSKEIMVNGKDIVDYKANIGKTDNPMDHHTLRNFFDAFDDISKKVGPEDSLFVFYAGHGGKSGMLPLDGRTIIDSGILEILLSEVKSLYSIVFANSCYSGDVAHRIGKNNIVSMSTSRRGKLSYMHSKFPEFVFSAIAGNSKADYNKNDKISIEEAFDYAAANDPLCGQVKSLKDILTTIGRFYYPKPRITPQLVYQNVNPAEVYLAEVSK